MNPPGRNRSRFLPLVLCAAALGLSAARAADVLTLTSGATVEGTFAGYRSNQFEMHVNGEARPRKSPLAQAASLTLDPAVQVDLRRRAGKHLDDVTFTGYQKPNFTFTTPTGPLSVSGVQLIAVLPKADMRREMQHVADATAEAATPHNADFKIAIHTGVTSVVHFHMDDNVTSIRQGNAIQARCADSKGRMEYTRITLSGWDDPAATRYQVTSVPQFWFFNTHGKLVTRLTDRFTTDDVDAAFRTATKR